MTFLKHPYHIGIVVDAIDKAQDELGRLLGISWAKTEFRPILLGSGSDPELVDLRFSYSIEGPPHLELIERRPASVYEELGLHHLGLWTDGSAAESVRLGTLGWTTEASVFSADRASKAGLYFIGAGRLRIEVVDIGIAGPQTIRYLAGEDFA